MRATITCLLATLLVLNLDAQKKMPIFSKAPNDVFLDSLLRSDPQLKPLLQRSDLNIQVIYTKIDRDENNEPSFTDYTYQLDKKNYFYPASTVKMPIAFLALQKLHELKKAGVDKYTAMLTDSSYPKQGFVYTQPTAQNSVPTIAHYIKQIFLVSDNDAFNRLYEFLGQEYIQKQLTKKGYPDAIIRHRLQVPLTIEQNKATNAVSFYDTAGNVLYAQPAQYSNAKYPTLNVQLGKGYYQGNELVNAPFNFSLKNRVYLQDQHNILRSVLFPESYPEKKRFNLAKEDYDFVLHWMSAYPKESAYPYYDSSSYWDAYCKFILHGSEKKELPGYIRIFNKPGDAYGFLTDIAYVVDLKNKVEFMLSATIACNTDGIFNDDKYDYETIGFPFMKNIGSVIYKYELQRERTHKPDLTKFNIDYQQQ